ncbi:LOW QUALITY PROTEIN: subtilisin-like protease SBT1.2 [Asparagus officinalis]|uniref:LOW QUALITY PROTEIN: subtilisin-like protease SBT1.2 n=1 Tax=Asparagus officinalis TaxID=4686 RepID=UPI00098E7E88|nr:LOW QUALITY PROTEIN: subtilisin-like protease SBT1.2 [Asparagus officinalis]
MNPQFSHRQKFSFIFSLSLLFLSNSVLQATSAKLETYIVHVHHPDTKTSESFSTSAHKEAWYKSFLPANILNSGEPRLIYSYHNVINAFAVRLTEEELAEVECKPGFLQAYPDRVVPLLTTHTHEFLGLHQHETGLWTDSKFGKGVIVGVLDTGIAPDHPSFRDNGLIPSPPAKWKGRCEFGGSVCNNKLIGARKFVRGLNAMKQNSAATLQGPPDDVEGHGTHTASTAAGMFVANVSIEEQAKGTAAGMAPYAHIAVYRVCREDGCAVSDILAGMDTAAADGVDIISLSLGGVSQPFYADRLAIGAFGATAKGITVVCSAGNTGPSPATLSNEAPWIMTVGASTLDRKIRTTVTLGDGAQFYGESIYQPKGFLPIPIPLAYPGSRSSNAAVCAPGSLSILDVIGKVVVCDVGKLNRVQKGEVVKKAGGVGMILTNTKAQGDTTFPDVHVLPASYVSYSDGLAIKSYIKSTLTPVASISFNNTVIGSAVLAPEVAYFSSRGPNQADPNILKPDIIGPGVNILAAWPFDIGSPGVKYNIISGTSMAAPHLSGIAALLVSQHPDWSPAAIKSAIMTTATATTNMDTPIPDEQLKPADLFAAGAGHVNPTSANDPGLIYDVTTDDYIPYLCGLRYSDTQVSAIAGRTVKCSNIVSISGAELNYPSFMVILDVRRSVTVTRTVTNVGEPGSTYEVKVKAPKGTKVIVEPEKLYFSKVKEKAQYAVTFTSEGYGRGGYSEGYLRWISSDNKRVVNSPIMVKDSRSTQSM